MNATNRLRSATSLLVIAAMIGCARGDRDRASDEEAMSAENGIGATEVTDQTETYPGTILPAGTNLVVALDTPISTKTNRDGDRFQASLVQALVVGTETIVPTGARVTGRLVEVRPPASEDKARITMVLDELDRTANERQDVSTAKLTLVAESSTEDDLEKVAVGGVAGGLIGGIIGGKKGALAGAAAGATAGVIVAIATNDSHITLPAGQKLQFTLVEPAEIAALAPAE